MNVNVITSKDDYDAAMAEADGYFENQPEPGSPEGNRFEAFLLLIENYENKHHPIAGADPIEVLEFAIRDLGRTQKELGDLLGARSRASEILNRKRPLNLDQIRTISAAWKLPIAALVEPYALAEKAGRMGRARVNE